MSRQRDPGTAFGRSEEPPPSSSELRRRFDDATAFTVGIEEEVWLLDPHDLGLAHRAEEVLARTDGDPRFKLELPRAQLEIVTAPVASVSEAAAQLLAARRELAERTRDLVRLACAGVHPAAAGTGALNRLDRYRHTISEYAPIAPRQLVAALQVHVAVGGAERSLAVYNRARSYLPLLAALAANAPFYEGRDSGLASVRPKLGELLPRQNVPPPLESWEQFADDLAWGARSGAFEPGAWWWELRPHRRHGTLEFRVPDAQTTVAQAAAVAAVIQALVGWLASRHDEGERSAPAPTWRIAENRWSACRHGTGGAMSDLRTGAVMATRESLHELLDELEPVAARLGAAAELRNARSLVERNGAAAQREVAAAGEGMPGLLAWMNERFLDPL